ncbi:hypothetical protein [Streptomyces sp. NPDC093109]|uniref:hypothetical protein n=1 Tax=Streptomyces sp. NPDC093109 TaxID=3154977 RepID=UPI00344B0E13
MDGIGDGTFDGEDLNLDALLWTRGVDYLTGWRDATQAATELSDALTAAGINFQLSRLSLCRPVSHDQWRRILQRCPAPDRAGAGGGRSAVPRRRAARGERSEPHLSK